MERKKRVIIIGAGLAGMSAGCYLQINGFDTEIFEMHTSSGGLCTSWKRKDYLIDGCIHFMSGTSPENSTYQFWNDIIDMQSIKFVYQDTHCVVEDKEQNRIYFYSDAVRLEKELLAKAPEDKKQINELIRGIKKFSTLKMPVFKPYENMTFTDKLKVAYQMLPYLFRLNKYVKITNKAFAAKLKNPGLRLAFETAFVGDSSLFYSIMVLVWRHKKETGYPIGGAVHISNSIEERYKQLGGNIHFNSNVARILTEDNMAIGIELENGGKYFGDIIVSAADGRTTIYEMLAGKFKDKNIVERYESKTFQTISKTLYVSVGVNKDFSNQPHKLFFPLGRPIRMDPITELDVLEISHYCDDPSAAPEGKSLLTLMPESKDWEYWYNLRTNNNQKYKKEKERIANEIIDALDKRFGGIKENLEMVDVVTPATYIHYTNNWTGGQTSWKPATNTFGKPTLWQIKGLSNFYMTGQWAGISGGLNNVVMMGNHLAQIICKNEGIKFYNTTKR
jgi:phytoene dehydrogenase-like protein